MLQEYIDYMVAYERSPRTVTSYSDTVSKYLVYLAGKGKTVEQTTHKDIIAYFVENADGSSPATKNQRLAAIKNFYEFLYTQDYIEHNFSDKVKRFKEPIREARSLEAEDIQRIVAAARTNRDKAIIVTAAICCLRCSEIVNLDLDDIMPDKTLHIIGKGNKERYVPYTATVEEYLKRYLKVRKKSDSPALFLSTRSRERMSTRGVQHVIETVSKRTGIEFHTHTLRHSGASLAYEATKDIVTVQEILGHSNLNTTRKYVHRNNEQKKFVLENNPLNDIL